MNTEQTNTSKIIYNLRKKKKLTQQQVADFLGISRTSYSHYETGRRIPEIEMLLRISSFYEINIMLMVFNLCLDIAEINNIKPSDIFKSFSCGVFYDPKIFDGINSYLTLPDNYKRDILAFIECAISCSNLS